MAATSLVEHRPAPDAHARAGALAAGLDDARQGRPPIDARSPDLAEAGPFAAALQPSAGVQTDGAACRDRGSSRADGHAAAAAPAFSDPPVRSLRHSGFVALLYGRDRLCRFWFQDLRRLALFLSLVRESRWLRGGEPGCFSLASLAGGSQMSVARASQLLGVCAATGDFVRSPDPRDARCLVFEPSPAARAGLERLVAEFCAAAAAFLGRPDPAPALGPAASRAVQRAFVEQCLSCLAEGDLGDRGLGSLTFLLAMADLALHSPVVAADFVRREAARLQVTTVTLRNVLRRAEGAGWTRRAGRMLSMPPEARERAALALDAMMLRFAAVLDEADAALAEQRRGAAPGDARPPLP